MKIFPCVPSGKEPATKDGWHEASDDPEQIRTRLETAAHEEAMAGQFDAVVVNADLGRAVDEVAAILAVRRSGPPPLGIS